MAKSKTFTVDELNEWVTMKPPSGVDIPEAEWPRSTRESFIVNHEPKGWSEVAGSASTTPEAPEAADGQPVPAPVVPPARTQS